MMEGPNEPVTNPFLRPSKLFGAESNVQQRSLLRPSMLTATAEKLRTDKPAGLEPTANPFGTTSQRTSSISPAGPLASNPFFKVKGKIVEDEEEKEATSRSTLAAAAAANMKEVTTFAPSNGSQLPLASKPASSGPVGFIFGKNISERVVKDASGEEGPPQAEQVIEQAPPVADIVTEESTEAGGSEEEATFGAIAAARSDDDEDATSSGGGANLEASKKSLSESAQEYQARQARPEFDEVEVLTGEEGESNVLHLICRAFLYDRDNNKWTERGRGFMRLNDAAGAAPSDRLRSRLIFRLQGSLKVVLNTPVWSGMLVEQADEKRIRLTAQVPEEGVRILLFQLNSANEAHHLLSALNSRILQLRQAEEADEAVGSAPWAWGSRKRRHSGASSDGGDAKERKKEEEEEEEEEGEEQRPKLSAAPSENSSGSPQPQ